MKYLSFSQINMYSRCGIQYHLRYIEGIKIPPKSALILGSAFHKAQEAEYINKIEKNEDLPIDEVFDILSDNIEEAFSEDVLLDEEEQSKGKEVVKAAIKDNGISMMGAYYDEIATKTQPVAVEEKFILDMHVPIIGFIDLITDEGIVADTKTAGKSPAKNEADKSQQLTIYALGYKELYGHLPESLRLDYVVAPCTSKKAKSCVVTLETKRNEEQIKRLARRVERIVDGINKGVFIPPDQGSWACSYCGYRDIGICNEYLI